MVASFTVCRAALVASLAAGPPSVSTGLELSGGHGSNVNSRSDVPARYEIQCMRKAEMRPPAVRAHRPGPTHRIPPRIARIQEPFRNTVQ